MCSELSWCVNNSEFKKKYQRAIDELNDEELSSFNKILLKKRFIPMVGKMEIEAKRVNFLYTVFQTATTLGSILVPALLSIEDKSIIFNATSYEQIEQSHNMFWTTWGISLMVTISNAFNQLLGLERKYIMRNIHLSQMKKEGWCFLEKSGELYSNHSSKTHNILSTVFFKRIEKLRHEQVVNDLSFDKFDTIDNDDGDSLLREVTTGSSADNILVRNTPI
jgi:hypothetical protein